MLDKLTIDQISSFLKDAEPRLIYPTAEFLNFLKNSVEGDLHCLCEYHNETLLGILPYFRLEKEHGVVINSLPWFGSHGGCYVHANADQTTVRQSLLYKFNEILLNEQNLITATISMSPFETPYYSLYESAFENCCIEQRIGQVLELPNVANKNNDEISTKLMTLMKQKARNCLRKGLKQNLSCTTDNSNFAWEFLYETHCENMLAIEGNPKELEHFNSLRNSLKEHACINLAMLNDIPIAAMLCLYYKPHVEYFIPVVKQKYRNTQALSALIHKGMIDAIKNGYKYWNFGGTWTTQTSLHHFKIGWGAKDMEYAYFVIKGNNYNKNIVKTYMEKYKNYYIFPYSS